MRSARATAVVVADDQGLQGHAAQEGQPHRGHLLAVDVDGGLHDLERSRAQGSGARPEARHQRGGRCRAGRRRRRGRRTPGPARGAPARAPASSRTLGPPQDVGATASDVQGAQAEDAVDGHHGQRGGGGAGEARAVAHADHVAADVAGQEVVEEGGHQVGRGEVGERAPGSPGPAGAARQRQVERARIAA